MDENEIDEIDEELLAGFHHTISEQLNSRLSESPKFFGLLVVVSTGYGYVLSNPSLCQQKFLVLFATILSYMSVLWASWYLAALGYAFRFLQNCQHCIEHKLGWAIYTPGRTDGKGTGTPPPSTIRNAFWLLPGIYHAHAFGLCVFLALICAVGSYKSLGCVPTCCAVLCGLMVFIAGITFTVCINMHYVRKFGEKRWQDPKAFDLKKPSPLPLPEPRRG